MNKGELINCFESLTRPLSNDVRLWLLPKGVYGSTCSDLEGALKWLRLFYRFGGKGLPELGIEDFKSVIPASYVAVLESFNFHLISKCSDHAATSFRILEDCGWVAMAAVDGVRGVLYWGAGDVKPIFIGKGCADDGSIRDYSQVLGYVGCVRPSKSLMLDVRLTLGVSLSVLSGFGFRGYSTQKDLIRVLLDLDKVRLAEIVERVKKECNASLFTFSLLYPVRVDGDVLTSIATGWGMYDEVIRRFGKTFGWLLEAVPRCCGDLSAKQRFKGYVWGLGHGGVLCLPLGGVYGSSELSARWFYDCVSVKNTGLLHVMCRVMGCYDFGVRREWVLGYYVCVDDGVWCPRVCGTVTTDMSSRPAYLLVGQVVEVVCRGCHENGVLINPVIQRVRFDLPESSVCYEEGIQSVVGMGTTIVNK